MSNNAPDMPSAVEWEQLHVRVIALENLLISLLSHCSTSQQDAARDMAEHISPRPGHTDHPLTVHAAVEIRHLVGRARHIQAERAEDT
jgi:hypothetical protein